MRLRKTNTVHFHLIMWNNRQKQTNKHQKTVTDTENKQVVARGRMVGGGKKQVRLINNYKLPVAK